MGPTMDLDCPVCDFSGNAGQGFRHLKHHIRWDLYYCPRCHFRFWHPLEQSPSQYFEEVYEDFADVSQPTRLGRRHKLLLENMPIKWGRCLDIGCGDGAFLASLRDVGFDVWGIDFNRKAIVKAKSVWGLDRLMPISIYDFANLSGIPSFDMITFFEVLEHIEAPRRFLKVVKSLLREKGYIAFSVPDSRVFGPWERQVNVAPYHTAEWTPGTLTTFLRNNDFDLLVLNRIDRMNGECILGNVAMKLGMIKRVPGSIPTEVGPVTISKPASRKLAKYLFRAVGFPISAVLYAFGIRTTIFGIAQLR